MPKLAMRCDLPTTPSEALTIARRLVLERGWSVESVVHGRLVTRRPMRLTAWPITIELSFAEAAPGTRLTAIGRIGGWGPIQRKHLAGVMDELRASLEFEASASSRAVTPPDRGR